MTIKKENEFNAFFLNHSSENPEKNINTFSALIIINVSWAATQHARLISEGSRDTEDCSGVILLKMQLW